MRSSTVEIRRIGIVLLAALAMMAPSESRSAGFFDYFRRTSICERLLGKVEERIEIAIPRELLAEVLADRVMKVAEFSALREICEREGVRCWLFGGTAAGYAHYVKWDLLREAGDTRYQKDRFDYDYTNIFRSTQDADLVIDGSAGQAERIEALLRERFRHFQGHKSVWEVRLLRTARGDKDALLDNPDFQNQHTDSNSTGLIEVTSPIEGENPIRDLRDWSLESGDQPIFFDDVYQGRLHFYFSSKHAQTRRAREGLNPPILSAIRYLTKAFQYELKVEASDRARIRAIIRSFDPDRDLKNGYVRGWIEKNGKKLFQNAINLEYAWNELEALGLREKLMGIGSVKEVDSLAWWLNREPLRSHPVGRGFGKTAAQLGISRVAHETRSFQAYESITRAHTGDPNVFISRDGAADEAAAFGNGFYTAEGKQGARGTQITVRFDVDPDAREGTDFLVRTPDWAPGSRFIVFLNRNALRVVPEAIELDLPTFYELLGRGTVLDPAEKAMFEKFKRRVSIRSSTLDAQDLRRIFDATRKVISATYAPEDVLAEFGALYLNLWARVDLPADARAEVETLAESSLQSTLRNAGYKIADHRALVNVLRSAAPMNEKLQLKLFQWLLVSLKEKRYEHWPVRSLELFSQLELRGSRLSTAALEAFEGYGQGLEKNALLQLYASTRAPGAVEVLTRVVETEESVRLRTVAAYGLCQQGIREDRVKIPLMNLFLSHYSDYDVARQVAGEVGNLFKDDQSVLDAFLEQYEKDKKSWSHSGVAFALPRMRPRRKERIARILPFIGDFDAVALNLLLNQEFLSVESVRAVLEYESWAIERRARRTEEQEKLVLSFLRRVASDDRFDPKLRREILRLISWKPNWVSAADQLKLIRKAQRLLERGSPHSEE